MLTWYGGWEVYDLLTEVDETKGGIALPHTSHVSNVIFLVVLVIVMLMKVLKNVISVPFEIALDLDTSEILLFPTYFKVKVSFFTTNMLTTFQKQFITNTKLKNNHLAQL